MKKNKLYYIEPVAIPGDNAHSIQIYQNLFFLKNYFDVNVYSYKGKNNLKFRKHKEYIKP